MIAAVFCYCNINMAPPRKLRSLDLFSGIGGITYGLRDVTKPLAYCEIDPHAQAVLSDNIARGLLPKAPVHSDVRTFHIPRSTRVDLIVAGFPCIGFSTSGLQHGYHHPESSLFFEILRIIDALNHKPMVFLENVGNILNIGMKELVVELAKKRGYELRWCILKASELGAPQRRRRWFCLAIPSKHKSRSWLTRRKFDTANFKPFDWSHEHTPRMTIASSRHRHTLLGNAVVPDVARYAFAFLMGAFAFDGDIHYKPLDHVSKTNRRHFPMYPTTGAIDSHRGMYALPDPNPGMQRDFGLLIDPKLYKSTKRPRSKLTSGRVTRPLHLTHWATLTSSDGRLGASGHLTRRNSKNFQTQVRYESKTTYRRRHVSAEFAEWVMGLPSGWTRAADAPRE